MPLLVASIVNKISKGLMPPIFLSLEVHRKTSPCPRDESVEDSSGHSPRGVALTSTKHTMHAMSDTTSGSRMYNVWLPCVLRIASYGREDCQDAVTHLFMTTGTTSFAASTAHYCGVCAALAAVSNGDTALVSSSMGAAPDAPC